MIHALFAVPGSLHAPTGGYGYARRLLAEARGIGLDLVHWPLPALSLDPSDDDLAEATRRLQYGPTGMPILIDGLALGVTPAPVLSRLSAPVVALCHHPLALETGVSKADRARLEVSERAALAAVAQVVTTSAATADILVAQFGVAQERITVARPGTDAAERAEGSGGLGVALLSVGALIPRKGHDVLIAALAELRDLDWHLTIAGPDDRDPPTAEALRTQIAGAGLAGRVTLAGACDAATIEALYRGADLFVLTSAYEGYGMAYTEAMAHGLPVVGTDTGAVREATRGGAHLIPPGDVAATASALRSLIGDATARRGLGERCWTAASGFPRWRDTAKCVAGAVEAVSALGGTA